MEAAVVVLKWSQTAAVFLKGYMQRVSASMTGLDDSPIRVIGVAIWSICGWLVLIQDMGMLLTVLPRITICLTIKTR